MQMNEIPNEFRDIRRDGCVKEAVPSEAGLEDGSSSCHGDNLSHFCGVEKSSEANFSTEVVKCTNRFSSLLITFLCDGSLNGRNEKEASGKKKPNKEEKDFLLWETC